MSKNLVNWFTYNDETLEKAQKEEKAIFIFVEYKGCELCQEMQEKVLKNKEVLDLLDRYFVCIKIDKDDRPDLDRYYQKTHSLINNRSGGWPTSIFCTPENKPFFAGTYIETHSKEGSIEGIGFIELAELIGVKIEKNDADTNKNAEEIYDFLQKKEYPTQATKLSESFVKNFMLQVKNNYEVRYGGFSQAPKFPQTATLMTLLAIDKNYNDKAAKAMLQNTLDNMSSGGYYDKANGGFYRYTLNNDYSSHSPDKTLYDNANLCEVYTRAYQVYQDDTYLEIAKSIADFCFSNMSENNLFYTSLYKDDANKKIQTSYVSMMIKSLFILGSIDGKYTSIAIKSLDTLMDTMFIDSQLYHVNMNGEEASIEAFLDDYAFLSSAFVSAYEHTHNEHYLINAQRFSNLALERFYDRGGWNFSESELNIEAEITDNTHTSAVSSMVNTLLFLGLSLKDEKYTHFAFKTLEYNSYDLGRKPSLMSSLLQVMLKYLKQKEG